MQCLTSLSEVLVQASGICTTNLSLVRGSLVVVQDDQRGNQGNVFCEESSEPSGQKLGRKCLTTIVSEARLTTKLTPLVVSATPRDSVEFWAGQLKVLVYVTSPHFYADHSGRYLIILRASKQRI